MIQIDKRKIVGWEEAIRGMRNPMNSWDKSDSIDVSLIRNGSHKNFIVGEKDQELMRKLSKAGTDHRKFMRMIVVYADINAPIYWWKEYDTYKVGTVANSCSTMHKIQDKEFTLDDFSCEHLSYINTEFNVFNDVIDNLNHNRKLFIETNDKKYWWNMIQILPTSFNQKRTVMLNYEVLANIYKSRKNHKLDEWVAFCNWIETLPYRELITGGTDE